MKSTIHFRIPPFMESLYLFSLTIWMLGTMRRGQASPLPQGLRNTKVVQVTTWSFCRRLSRHEGCNILWTWAEFQSHQSQSLLKVVQKAFLQMSWERLEHKHASLCVWDRQCESLVIGFICNYIILIEKAACLSVCSFMMQSQGKPSNLRTSKI
jgi:hypothetical protein